MPKVVISGYYGFHNSGDEAILYAMLVALRDVVPDLEVVVLSGDPAYTAQEFGVRAISRDNPAQVFRALRECQLLISGAGGLLQDINGPRSIIYYLGVVLMAGLLGKPVFFYAQGFGPVNSALGKALVRWVAKGVHTITLRDPDSKDEMCGLGVAGARVEVTADPVLGLNPDLVDREKGRKILNKLGADKRPLAGISVRPWKGLDGYKEIIARVADDLLEKGWQVVLVPMHCPGDLTTCREVAARMQGRALLFAEQADYMNIMSVTANLDLAIGMRLHFLIFSVIFGVPVVGIPYDPKVNRFLQSVGLPDGFSAENLEYAALSQGIRSVLEQRDVISKSLKARVKPLRARALKNALMVAELLGSI
ncbi:MAG: polysaccharide pyruvyl transferase CsaB [Peptococcaceae bacterium]|nr:polysaccharide pyruvyl transferase CsaB [Peptococcaceae bacterium]